MSPERLQRLLTQVANGTLSTADATEQLRHLPYQDIDFARIDHHRQLRQGMPEVIYGAGKSVDQIITIATAMLDHGTNVLCTRVGLEAADALRENLDASSSVELTYHRNARAFTAICEPVASRGRVAVVCAGTSDLSVADEAAVSAEFFGAEVTRLNDVGVAGLARLLNDRKKLDDHDVVIVVAGMEGALPSVIGGLLATPVIAVPTSVGYGASFDGLSALLGMLNSCAAGVTVVNIDNGFGAAAAACRILVQRSRN